MPLPDLVAGLALLGLLAYGVLGGADFGGGVWDLLASGATRKQQRQAIARAMGPVWEANHVWLIFVIVLLFSAYPPAFSALSIALFWPFHLALCGITLRGAAFVFRGYGPQGIHRRTGVVFGVASLLTPALLGMSVGAVSSGVLRVYGSEVRPAAEIPWLTPIALAMGAIAVATSAYLAAVFLCIETRDEAPLLGAFRRRALLSGTAVVGLSVLALPLCRAEAPHLYAGLFSPRALPVLLAGGAAALLAGAALYRSWFHLARAAAVVQVGCLLLGWGLAQYPYLIYPDLRLSEAAAPAATLRFILYTFPLGAALLLPSLWYLFRVFKSAK